MNTNFTTRAVVNINVTVAIAEPKWTAIRLDRQHGSYLESSRLTTSARVMDGWNNCLNMQVYATGDGTITDLRHR